MSTTGPPDASSSLTVLKRPLADHLFEQLQRTFQVAAGGGLDDVQTHPSERRAGILIVQDLVRHPKAIEVVRCEAAVARGAALDRRQEAPLRMPT